MISLITAFLSLMALVLEMMAQRKTAEEEYYARIQKRRRDIIDGVVATVQSDLDRLLVEAGGTAGSKSDADTAQRLDNILGKGVVSQ